MTAETAPAAVAGELEARRIAELYPGALLGSYLYRGDTRLMIAKEFIVDVCRLMRDDPELQYNFFGECLGVDYLDKFDDHRFEVVYNLSSVVYEKDGQKYGTGRRIFLKVPVPEEDAVVPSVMEVYPGANLPEREIYDMFGIRFAGHPDLRRLLMSDDWVGYPQRKDYPLGGERVRFPEGRFGPAVGEVAVAHAGESYYGRTGDTLGEHYKSGGSTLFEGSPSGVLSPGVPPEEKVEGQ